MLESHYYKDMIEAGCDEAGRGLSLIHILATIGSRLK